MKKKKVDIKLLLVRGHQLCEQPIKTSGVERGIEILYNMRRNVNCQMVGVVDADGKKYFVGNVLSAQKVEALHRSPQMSTWDHLVLGMLRYKTQVDPTKHIVQVNAKDPIFVLLDKGDVVLDPLMNQIFPPTKAHLTEKTRE
ncbi:MAG: hypothetical protein II942_03665 [Alphaproteobacteria bacterium]|nr:hypothetical protein [Alphaproteobacteria bacterium]